jgi:acid stress-induced BolA-like protein IbaG/YrbA
MDIQPIEQAIAAALPEAQIYLEGEGCDFTAIVISDSFQGLSPVKRQQQILATVAGWLATGELHAFTVRAYTEAEWANQQAAAAGGLVQIQL